MRWLPLLVVMLAGSAEAASPFRAEASAAPPRVCLVVHASGFSDDDTARLLEKAGLEVRSSGADLLALSRQLEVKAECLEAPDCARDIMHTASASRLVWVDATRAGARVQMSVRLLDDDGSLALDDDAAATADGLLGDDPVLTTRVMAALKSDVAKTMSNGAARPDPKHGVANGKQPFEDAKLPPPIAAEPPNALVIGGIAAAAAGVVVGATGIIVTIGQLGVISDPASLGTDKELASVLVPVMATVAVVGGGLVVGGGALFVLGSEDSPLDEIFAPAELKPKPKTRRNAK